jgi:hypothetical protein
MRSLLVLPGPIIGNLAAMRGHTVFIGVFVIIELGGNIDADGLMLADTLESMVNEVWDGQADGVVNSEEELVDLPTGG